MVMPVATRRYLMAKSNNEQRVIAMTPATSDLSRPVLHRDIELFSLEAQRVAERVLDRVGYALFSIEVILQLMADREQIVEIESIISGEIAQTDENLLRECERLNVLMKEGGITENDIPTYTRPRKVRMEISSPLIVNYGQLLIRLDELTGLVDALWLNGVFNNQQRQQANQQWQRHLNKLSGRIIDIEGRTRRHAKSQGRASDVDAKAPARDEAKKEASPAPNESTEGAATENVGAASKDSEPENAVTEDRQASLETTQATAATPS